MNETSSSQEIHPEFVSVDDFLAGLSDPKIIETIKSLKKGSFQKSKASDYADISSFEKVSFAKYDQYTLHVDRDYNISKPYDLFFIVTIDKNNVEKSAFLNYVHAVAPTTFDIKKFTGNLEIFNSDFILVGGAGFNQGVQTTGTQSLTIGSVTCITSVIVTMHTCSHGGEHEPGQSCNDGFINDAYYSFQIVTNCYTTYIGVPGNFVGGGGVGPGLPQSTIFYNSLNSSQKNFLDNNQATRQSIYRYLNKNGWTNSNKAYVKAMIDISIADGGNFTLDESITTQNALVFDDMEEFEDHLDLLNTDDITITYDTSVQNEKVATATVNMGVLKLKLNVKQKVSPYEVLNVTSTLSGFTYGNNWEQSDYSVESNPGSNIVTVTILGTHEVSILPAEIGTVYSKQRKFVIRINKTTGNVINAYQDPY